MPDPRIGPPRCPGCGGLDLSYGQTPCDCGFGSASKAGDSTDGLRAEIQVLHDLVTALARDMDRLGRRVQRLEVDPNA